MSTLNKDRYHRAARAGCIDLLQNTTRKDCNAPDKEGKTPTQWAAYYGHLNALRLLIGRGGNPDKCDYFGNTALHYSVANGHMNCVSFLVNFGANVWALNNDFQSAKDVAVINCRDEIMRFLNRLLDMQVKQNSKQTSKLKDKALRDAEKRVKNLQKIQRKATKLTEQSERELKKQWWKMSSVDIHSDNCGLNLPFVDTGQTLKTSSQLLYAKSSNSSDIVIDGQMMQSTQSLKLNRGVLSKKVQQRKQETVRSEVNSKEIEKGKNKLLHSLFDQRRNTEMMFFSKYDPQNNKLEKQHRRLKDSFSSWSKISRSRSEPYILQPESSISEDDFSAVKSSKILKRPKFGSTALSGSITGSLRYLSSSEDDIYGDSIQSSEKFAEQKKDDVNDSIGSASSLAYRYMPWKNEEATVNNNTPDFTPIILFLAANEMTEYLPLFMREKIDLQSLVLLTDNDLKDLGLPLGPRRKLSRTLKIRKEALENPGLVIDSKV
ncbi:Usher syndrome type-1G protein homolog [Limulus polyphemus]|uniref:NAD(+) ADP-ribosyltransferase n=1 Tax=Limulus polyphemus TaxID=6850 RepID=A0ABM1B1X3_LIMPO|nr:Usher syndrome type-1G protein homolog [Limulus polyphemus]